MSYFNILRRNNRVTIPPFWTDQSYFLRDGFIMGFTLEFLFLYFNAYDNFTRKATLKCLDSIRYEEYKLKEKSKLDEIKKEKMRKLNSLKALKVQYEQDNPDILDSLKEKDGKLA